MHTGRRRVCSAVAAAGVRFNIFVGLLLRRFRGAAAGVVAGKSRGLLRQLNPGPRRRTPESTRSGPPKSKGNASKAARAPPSAAAGLARQARERSPVQQHGAATPAPRPGEHATSATQSRAATLPCKHGFRRLYSHRITSTVISVAYPRLLRHKLNPC